LLLVWLGRCGGLFVRTVDLLEIGFGLDGLDTVVFTFKTELARLSVIFGAFIPLIWDWLISIY
jgi:hypothetical protein